MPFYYALADASGNKITASETLLSPGPSVVEYPTERAGSQQETAGGVIVIQQPSRDPRQRSWIWRGFPGWWPRTEPLWAELEPLRSSRRIAMGQGNPYVFLRDTETQLLQRLVTATGTATGGGPSALVNSGGGFTVDAYIGMRLTIVSGTGAGQVRTISDNDTTTLTVSSAWTTQPVSGSVYAITGVSNDWFRVRVIAVIRELATAPSLVTYEQMRMQFVMEDSTFNNLG